MSHTIELPDETYQAIERYAAQRGETPEAVIEAAIIAWAANFKEQLTQSTSPDDGVDDPTRDPWRDSAA